MTPTEKLSQQIDAACITRMLDQYSPVLDGELHHWKHLAIALEGHLYQALEREARLEAALIEAGLDIGEPWDANQRGDLESLKVHIPEHPTVLGETKAERARRYLRLSLGG